MNEHHPLGSGTESYLVPAVFERVDPMLDTLRPLLPGGPIPFIAICALDVLSVAPSPRHADFLLSAAEAWFERAPRDQALWFELGTGKRIVGWLRQASDKDPGLLSPTSPHRARLESVLGKIAALGVSEAHEMEVQIAADAGAPNAR